jgi:hypothetical protein
MSLLLHTVLLDTSVVVHCVNSSARQHATVSDHGIQCSCYQPAMLFVVLMIAVQVCNAALELEAQAGSTLQQWDELNARYSTLHIYLYVYVRMYKLSIYSYSTFLCTRKCVYIDMRAHRYETVA